MNAISEVLLIKLSNISIEADSEKVIAGTAPTLRTSVFVLNGITYVPHMTKPCFVGPGYIHSDGMKIYCGKEFTLAELVNLGARRQFEFLWPTTLAHGEPNYSFREVERFTKPAVAPKSGRPPPDRQDRE